MILPTRMKIPLAAGATAGIFYILCVILTSIDGLDEVMLAYLNVTMHGINITEVWAPSISAAGFVVGVIATFITWLVIGWVFSVLLGIFEKK